MGGVGVTRNIITFSILSSKTTVNNKKDQKESKKSFVRWSGDIVNHADNVIERGKYT